jgi:hypothetical protein
VKSQFQQKWTVLNILKIVHTKLKMLLNSYNRLVEDANDLTKHMKKLKNISIQNTDMFISEKHYIEKLYETSQLSSSVYEPSRRDCWRCYSYNNKKIHQTFPTKYL